MIAVLSAMRSHQCSICDAMLAAQAVQNDRIVFSAEYYSAAENFRPTSESMTISITPSGTPLVLV
jgi:hypothetical protein